MVVVRKVLEGEESGGCLFSSRATNNDAGAIAKSRGSRASATQQGKVRQSASCFLAARAGVDAHKFGCIPRDGCTFTKVFLYVDMSYRHGSEYFSP